MEQHYCDVQNYRKRTQNPKAPPDSNDDPLCDAKKNRYQSKTLPHTPPEILDPQIQKSANRCNENWPDDDEVGDIDIEKSTNVDENQSGFEKTILHKAMIGIGPYLVEKAVSVLSSASRSYSGDLVLKPDHHINSGGIKQRKYKTSSNPLDSTYKRANEPTCFKSRSHSLTHGFHKLRLTATNRSRSNTSGMQSLQDISQSRNRPRKIVDNKSSSSVVGLMQQQQQLKFPDSNVSKRLASARRSMTKDLKCRITQLENQLKESRRENRILQRMQHRHEIALSKYEGAEAELPKLIRSHVSEVRSLQENLRKAQSANRSMDERMRNRDTKIFRLEEENKALLALVKQNNLGERSNLASQLEQARAEQAAAETRLAELQRHIEILEKNHRHQISVETKKLRICNNKLFEAHQEIDKLYMALKESERVITCMRIRQGHKKLQGNDEVLLRCMHTCGDNASVRSSQTFPVGKAKKNTTSENGTFLNRETRLERSINFASERKTEDQDKFSHDQNVRDRKHHQEYRESTCGNTHPKKEAPGTVLKFDANQKPCNNHDAHEGSRQDTCLQSEAHTRTLRSETETDVAYNFADLSIEDDVTYHPQKSLFMGAIDSSCNVSSMDQSSPKSSLMSPAASRRERLRSSSAGPKLCANNSSKTEGRLFCRNVKLTFDGDKKTDERSNCEKMPGNFEVSSPNQMPSITREASKTLPHFGSGDTKIMIMSTGRNHSGNVSEAPDDKLKFISQNPLSVQDLNESKSSIVSSSSGSDLDDNTTASDYSKLTSSPCPNYSDITIVGAKHEPEMTIARSPLSAWEETKSSEPARSDKSASEQQDSVAKHTEMITGKRKSEGNRLLTNRAYFSDQVNSKQGDSPCQNVESNIRTSRMFKTVHQPFFQNCNNSPRETNNAQNNSTNNNNNNPSQVTPLVKHEPPSERNLKECARVRHQVGTCAQDETVEYLSSTVGSVLEPRQSLPPCAGMPSSNRPHDIVNISPVNLCDSDMPCKSTPSRPPETLRKKFSIGVISSMQGNVQRSSAVKKPSDPTRSRPSPPNWK